MRTVPRRSSLALLAAAVAALAAPGAAVADQGQIIVKYAAGADAHARADARANADVTAAGSLPLTATQVVTPESGTTVTDAVADLERSPDVAYAEPDQPRHAFDLYPDEAAFDADGTTLTAGAPFTNLWGFANQRQVINGFAGVGGADIGAPAAWGVTTGSADVKVAVVDSGVDRTHPDLFANLVPGYDFAYDDADPTDYYGHGTHVAGIIAARGDNGVGITGVTWQTSLMPVQALDATGTGSTSDIVEAYDYAERNGARIVNASFGGTEYSQAEYDAIKRDKDVLFVVAAGNDGASDDNAATASYPCAYDLPNILCVAATDNWDELATWSNRGPRNVDIAAPGVDVYSTTRCGTYGFMSGTSMAAPEVSGAAALVLAQDGSLTPQAVRQRLMDSVDKIHGLATAVGSGGRLDVAKALGVTPFEQTTPPASGTNGTAGATPATAPPAATVAAPRENEPAAPAPTCPTAPVRTPSSSGNSAPAPAQPSTPTPAPAKPAPAPAPTTPAAPVRSTPPVAPTVDRTAPVVALSLSTRGALTALLKSRLRIRTTVSERASLRVDVRLDARTAKTLHLTSAKSGVRIATGSATGAGAATVTLKLTSAAKRALARVRSVKATVTATATDAAGNRGTRSRTLTIKR
jgi:thermitase